MNKHQLSINWSKNVIIADADYIDSVAGHLRRDLGRMLGRALPPADLAQWLDCVALDGGLRPTGEQGQADHGGQETQVILVHTKEKDRLEHFNPADLNYIDGKAFSDNLGEFIISTYAIEDIAGGNDLLTDILDIVAAEKAVERLMVIPFAENDNILNKVRETLERHNDSKRPTTVFAMKQIEAEGNCRMEILGYSVMKALGVRPEEMMEVNS